MLEFHPLYIVDEAAQKKSVVLPYQEWEKILQIMEEFDDISAYQKAKTADDEFIPFDQAVAEIYADKLN